jgi:hypothetical protein
MNSSTEANRIAGKEFLASHGRNGVFHRRQFAAAADRRVALRRRLDD